MKILYAIVLMAFLLTKTGGAPAPFIATAYALRGRTASGHRVARGVVAADTRILPLGTKIHIEGGEYTGVYFVRDTGGKIRGRKIDIWMPSSREAKAFGKRKVNLTILSLDKR